MTAILDGNGCVELRDLEYFLACVEEGHFTRAARWVHAAQPTLSHAIARLERQVGERLLDREPRARVRPTDAGQLLVVRARAALAAVSGFDADLAELRGLERGELRIASTQSLNVTLLPGTLARFSARHPGVSVRVRTCAAEVIAAAVRERREDVGLLAGAPPGVLGELDVETLYREEFVAVVRRDDPLARLRGGRRRAAFSELRDRKMVLVPEGTFTADVIHAACAEAGFTPRLALTVDSGEALRETVRAGLGLSILPERYLPRDDRDLVAIRMTRPTPVRAVLLVRPREHRARTADAFVPFLRAASAGRR
jgi:DNA-binding transcriptional LysR family regulator